MKKTLMILTLTLLSSAAMADISSFVGQYTLTAKNEVAGAECFIDIQIANLNGYGTTIDLSYIYQIGNGHMPISTSLLVSAVLDGADRVHAGSHDATSATKHYDKATLSNDVLTMKTKYTPRLFGIPLGFESDTYSFIQDKATGMLKSKRVLQTNLVSKTSQCVYKKVN